MAAVNMTASTASGYITNVQVAYFGSYRVWTAHYSSPSAGSMYVSPGMNFLRWYDVEDGDPTSFVPTTNSIGSLDLYFSGLITGATGNIFILGN